MASAVARLGVRPECTDGFDYLYDEMAPPLPPGQWVDLTWRRPSWDPWERFLTDWRSQIPSPTEKTWPSLIVESTDAAIIYLVWWIDGGTWHIPSDYVLTLYDEGTTPNPTGGTPTAMTAPDGEFAFSHAGGAQRRYFHVAVLNPSVGEVPECSISYEPASPTRVDTILFDSNAYDPDGTVESCLWDFGDGHGGSGLTTTHQYAAMDTYTVTVTVTDNDGNTTICTAEVTVGNSRPACEFTETWPGYPEQPEPYCGDEITFTATGSDGDGTVVRYDWNFGDGGIAEDAGSEVTHIYGDVGTYNVVCTVTDNDGGSNYCSSLTFPVAPAPPVACFTESATRANPGQSINFDASCSTSACTTIQTYTWDFGDGTGGYGLTVSHAWAEGGNYDVTLTTADDEGLFDTETHSISINFAPTCGVTFLPSEPTIFDPIDFDSHAADSDGTVASAEWDFGDGGTGSGLTASHQYAEPGTYEVCVVVTDDEGAATTCCASVIVINLLPTCSVEFEPPAPTCADPTTFTCTASDQDGTVVAYDWDFGDGSTDSGSAVVTHTYAGPGDYTACATVTDDHGGQATCCTAVPVIDDTAPTISQCATDKTLSADAGCQAAIPDLTGEVVASDDCDPSPSITQSPTAGTLVGLGGHLVTITVSDASGNSTTCTATVTVVDDTAPTITTCAGDQTLSADGSCQAAIPDLTAGVVASDNCDVELTITQSPTAGTLVDLGAHTVTLTVTDDAGNETTCTATVTVIDDTAPTITTCAGDKTLSADATCQAAVPDLTGEVVATDNCDAELTVTQSPTAGTLVGLGAHTVTLTVTDDAGNEATCTATVTVIDDTAPTITTCASDQTLSADANCEALIPDLTGEVVASDNCDAELTTTQSPVAGTPVSTGAHTVTLSVTDDAGNESTCTATVTVIDDTAPSISQCASDQTVSADGSCQGTIPDLTVEVVASDNCDAELALTQSPAVGTLVDPGAHTVTLTVADDAGNETICTATVTVVDDTAPSISQCASDQTVSADGSCQGTIPDLTGEVVATDNCDLTPVIAQSPAAGTVVALGAHMVTLTVTDDGGNQTTCTATVTVVDDTAPSISQCASDKTVSADGSCQGTVPDLTVEVVASDNCDAELTITQSLAAGALVGIGPNTVILTVTDDAGNEASCTATVTVIDDTAPTITQCASDQTVSADGSCQGTIPDMRGGVQATDNCDPSLTVTQSPTAGTLVALGDTTVTLTVMDDAGNQTTCTATVTVIDDMAPSISHCPTDKTLSADASCQAPIPDLTGELIATDNCDPELTVTQSPTAGTLVTVGGHAVTLTVEDDAGNQTTCTVMVSVIDDIVPSISQCASDQTVSANGSCEAAIPDLTVEVVASDNCDAELAITQSPEAGTIVSLGSHTITLTATDDWNNQATCTATVTVIDDMAPTISQCAGDKTLSADTNCEATIPDLTGEVVASDNCDAELTVTQSPTAGSLVALGAHIVTLTVADDAGNEATCTATVTVVDDTAPSISQCASDQTVSADGSCQGTIPDLTIEVVASDNCDAELTITQSPAAGALVGIGPNTVTLTVTDDAGNEASCTATVTVIDDTAPTITQCASDEAVSADGSCQGTIPDMRGGVQATDNCDPSLTVTQSPTAGTLVALGDTTVTLTAMDDAGNQTSCTATATVIDDMAPSITQCASDRTLSADANCEATIPDLTGEVLASDNCDPTLVITQSPAAGTVVGVGDHTVTLTVADDAGNEATCTATVTVVDDTAPSISQCASDQTVSANGSCEAAIPDLTVEVVASDNCDAELTITQSPTAGSLVALGAHIVTLTVADDAGNEATCTATVTVVDDTAPSISQCASDQTVSADGSCQGTVPDLTVEVVASDNCDAELTVTQSPAAGTLVGPGAHTVTLTVTDDAGNEATCTATVSVIDDTAPSISQCASDQTVSADESCQGTIPDLTVEVVASDNCDAELTITQSPTAGTLVASGAHTVTLTVTDDAGNEATCTATVTVVDDAGPVMICPPDVLVHSPTCESMAVDIGTATATDNCDGTVTPTNDAPALFAPGVTVVTWTACDLTGNCSSCEQTVEVNCSPSCNVTYEPADPTRLDVVQFDSHAADSDGTIVSAEWTFGDGATGTGVTTSHQYAVVGTFDVCVTVTDDDGATTTCCSQITVSNLDPTCCYTYSPADVRVNRTVWFYGTCSEDPDGTIESYDWTFGDGGAGTGETATHVYAAEGSYQVCLTVTDNDGASASCCTYTIDVGPEPNDICVTLTGNRWHLMSLPCQPINADPWYVFNKNLLLDDPQAINIHSALFRYDPDTQGYVTYNYYMPGSFGPIQPGDGYWLWLFEDATFCYDVECPSEDFDLPLPTYGWYMIGQPHPGDSPLHDEALGYDVWLSLGGGPPETWLDRILAGFENWWVQDPVIYFEPDGYHLCGLLDFEDDTLRQFKGYWMYTFVDDLTLIIPPLP